LPFGNDDWILSLDSGMYIESVFLGRDNMKAVHIQTTVPISFDDSMIWCSLRTPAIVRFYTVSYLPWVSHAWLETENQTLNAL
jgi:hypothetical protein